MDVETKTQQSETYEFGSQFYIFSSLVFLHTHLNTS